MCYSAFSDAEEVCEGLLNTERSDLQFSLVLSTETICRYIILTLFCEIPGLKFSAYQYLSKLSIKLLTTQ